MKNRLQRTLRKLSSDEKGLTTVEYIIILCLIAMVGFSAWTTFGEKVESKVKGAESTIGGLPTS